MTDVDWPKTTPRHYLTSTTALNIPSAEGTGDWHMFEMFQWTYGRPPGPFLVAGINTVDTHHIFGDAGIYDASEALRDTGIKAPQPLFAADHYRAMADLLLQRLEKGYSLDSCDADDWFPAPEDKAKLRTVVMKALAALPADQSHLLSAWISSNNLEDIAD